MKWSVQGEPRYMAKGKLYTSGNSHVISTVHEQTVEQRAGKLAQRDTSLLSELHWRETCKNPPNVKNGNSTHDCPHLQACVRIIDKFYEWVLTTSFQTASELNQTEQIVHVATVKRGLCFCNIAYGTEERRQSQTVGLAEKGRWRGQPSKPTHKQKQLARYCPRQTFRHIFEWTIPKPNSFDWMSIHDVKCCCGPP